MTKERKALHSITVKEIVSRDVARGTCAICGDCDLAPNGWEKNRPEVRRWKCGHHNKSTYGDYVKGSKCECCGRVAKYSDQLVVHHKNGVNSDQTYGNHVTMCDWCHKECEAEANLMLLGKLDPVVWDVWIQRGFISKDYLFIANKRKR